MSHASHRAAAVEAVRQASRLCRSVQAHLVASGTLTKGDRSPVTVADFGAQAVVSHLLSQSFPDIPLIGEEDAGALRQPDNNSLRERVIAAVSAVLPGLSADTVLDAIDRGTDPGGPSGQRWALDPIDGTKGFLRLDQYAIALALLDEGEVAVGVLGCPSLPMDADNPDAGTGCLFVAVRGEGAFQCSLDDGTERRIQVTDIRDPAAARFCESVESGHSAHDDSALIAERLGISSPPFRIDSQCKYAAVARGDASIYLRLPTQEGYVERIWDHAAGVRVILEAGGAVSDTYGNPLDFSLGRGLEKNKGVIVTNGHLHAAVLEATAAVLGL